MSLNFNPYPILDPEQYRKERPSFQENVLNPIGQAFQGIAQNQIQRKALERQALLDTYLKNDEARKQAEAQRQQEEFGINQVKNQSDYGTPISPDQPAIGMSSLMPGGQGGVATMGQPNAQGEQVAQPVGLKEQFAQWQAKGMPQKGALPQYMTALSKDERKQFYDAPMKEREFNQKQTELGVKTSEKDDQFDQKEWDKIVKDSDPLTATSRSALGLASRAGFNANRALTTLQKGTVTNQEAGNVMADIASIYQGGSATQYGMSHQGYNTLYGKLQGALQAISGKPQDALPDAIKQRLLGVLGEMQNTNNAVIKQQLDHIEAAQPRVINKYRDEWKKIRLNLEGGVAGGPDQGQSPLKQFNSVQEAEAANLPIGTKIVIAGRSATVQ